MPRQLVMRECVVPEQDRGPYAHSVAARAQQARHLGAYFWVFEHAGERGRFVEFVEAAGSDALTAACTVVLGAPPGDCWMEFQGA